MICCGCVNALTVVMYNQVLDVFKNRDKHVNKTALNVIFLLALSVFVIFCFFLFFVHFIFCLLSFRPFHFCFFVSCNTLYSLPTNIFQPPRPWHLVWHCFCVLPQKCEMPSNWLLTVQLLTIRDSPWLILQDHTSCRCARPPERFRLFWPKAVIWSLTGQDCNQKLETGFREQLRRLSPG